MGITRLRKSTSVIDWKLKMQMHQPLLTALANFDHSKLLAGTRLFHGASNKTNGNNDLFGPTSGAKKWLSENVTTACAFAYDGTWAPDGSTITSVDRCLWVCELTVDVPALIGSQFSLQKYSPWLLSEFPSRFPNEFAEYACEILGSSLSYALLDHIKEERAHEVLVTNPANTLKILERIDLPASKPEAEVYLTARFPDAV